MSGMSNPDDEVPPHDQVLQLVEDELHISKRDIVTGKVRIRTVTDAVEELVEQELHGDAVEIDRVPIDRILETGADLPKTRTEGDVTIIPVLEEILVVEKRLVLKEELRITRRSTQENAQIPVTVRRQRAVIERLDVADQAISTKENDNGL